MTDRTFEVRIDGEVFANIEAGLASIARDLDRAMNRAAPRVSRALLESLQLVARELERLHGNPWDGSVAHSNPTLFRRSGGGLRSIRDSIRVAKAARLEAIEGQIGTGNMTVHETGGSIRPRRSRFLTIPLPAAMNSRGQPLRQRARDWDNTFVQRSRRGNLLIFQRNGPNITPLYLLKPSVRIRPRLGLEDSVIKNGLPWFERRAFEEIARELDRA